MRNLGENAGVIISLLAAAAAIFSAYEAEKSRQDANASVERTLRLQEMSLKEQIRVQQFSAAPIIYVNTIDAPVVSRDSKDKNTITAKYEISVGNQSSALNVDIHYACDTDGKLNKGNIGQRLSGFPNAISNVITNSTKLVVTCGAEYDNDNRAHEFDLIFKVSYSDIFNNSYRMTYCLGGSIAKTFTWRPCLGYIPELEVLHNDPDIEVKAR